MIACSPLRRWFTPILLFAGILGTHGAIAEAQTVPEESEGPTAAAVAPATTYDHDQVARARAVRADAPISVNGFLTEAVWADAPAITDFLQTLPDEGAPVSERTEVRIVYDDDAVYVGAVLYDRSPVTTRLARRDAGLGDSDRFVVMFDSYHDHETAYRFWTNPSGVKGDAIVTGNASGSGDSSWDPVWELATQVTEDGWTVEMRIPFSQLRFRPEAEQVWGIQIERSINRTRENATFPFTANTERAGVSRFAHLDGIGGIVPGRRLELLPYIVARSEYVQLEDPSGIDFGNPYRSGSDHFGNAGLDLKYRISSNVTLDAAINPDFGQVELDPSVINLTAFETRYQERRPFFVEGADIFTFGEAGPMGSVGRPPELVYSRRIGGSPTGGVPGSAVYSDIPTASTIAGAMKVTGRIGDGWSLGILEAVTTRETAAYIDSDRQAHRVQVEPTTNYLVGRVRRQIRGGQTRFGMIASAVNRDLSDADLGGRLHSDAYATGIDFAHESPDRVWLFTSLVSASHVRGDAAAITRTQRSSTRYYQRPDADHLDLDPAATSLSGLYLMGYAGKQAGNFTMRNGVAYLSPGYEVNDFGFQSNADRILLDTHYQWTEPNPGRHLRSWSFILGGPNAIWNTNGDLVFANINTIGRIELLNYWGTSLRILYAPRTDDDGLTRGGPMARTPGGWSGSFSVNSDGRRTVVARSSFNWGSDDAGGWNRSVSLNFGGRFEETIQVDIGPSYSWSRSAAQYVTQVADPLAEATYGTRYVFAPIDRASLSVNTRVNLTFSPTLSLQLYAEPFISTGDYGPLMEFREPNTFDFLEYGKDIGTLERDAEGGYQVDPDGAGPAPSFRVTDRDFNYRSLLGNAVLRWEWRPGSTLFLVWQQRRVNSVIGRGAELERPWVGDFDLSRDLPDMFDVKPDNIFMIKVNYWVNP